MWHRPEQRPVLGAACPLRVGASPRTASRWGIHEGAGARHGRRAWAVGCAASPRARRFALSLTTTIVGSSIATPPRQAALVGAGVAAAVGVSGILAALRSAGPRRRGQGAALIALPMPGPIFDQSGPRLGRHQGLADYTVGQRKGPGVTRPSRCTCCGPCGRRMRSSSARPARRADTFTVSRRRSQRQVPGEPVRLPCVCATRPKSRPRRSLPGWESVRECDGRAESVRSRRVRRRSSMEAMQARGVVWRPYRMSRSSTYS